MTSLVKGGSVGKSLPTPNDGWAMEDLAERGEPSSCRPDRYVVRDETQSIDRYYGPYSLYALCREFHDDPMFDTSSNELSPGSDVTIGIILDQMCIEAGSNEQPELSMEHGGICLPPRQFLNIVVGQFFKNADYATDIFVRSTFQTQLERVYSSASEVVDEAWAICFNVIVLLAIGKDNSGQGNSPFTQPFLQILRLAMSNPRVYLTPRLVNVQALALLVSKLD